MNERNDRENMSATSSWKQKFTVSAFVMKEELTRFDNGLGVGCEGKKWQ